MTPPSAAAAPAVHPRRPLTPQRPFRTAPRPRRVSGPARAPLVDRPARRRSPEYAGAALWLTEALSRLSEHRLLDRLIRGRTWIALVAFALIGIVTLQLGLLRLNAGIGHALQKEASLQRENAALSIENSELAAGDLVESSAARLGMEVVPVGALRFLTTRSAADASRAAAALSAPVGSSSGTAATGEGSSGSAATGGPSAGAEGSTQSSGSQPSSPSSGSEAEGSKTPASESAAAGASTPSATTGSSPTNGPSPTQSSAEQSTPGSEPAAAPASGGGATEPSGGIQAGSTGR